MELEPPYVVNESFLQELENKGKNMIPVHCGNAVVKYFIESLANNGVEMKTVKSAWGEFVLLNGEMFEQFEQFRTKVDAERLLHLSPPALYFLCTYEGAVNAEILSENFVLLEHELMDEYKSFCMKIKSQLAQ